MRNGLSVFLRRYLRRYLYNNFVGAKAELHRDPLLIEMEEAASESEAAMERGRGMVSNAFGCE